MKKKENTPEYWGAIGGKARAANMSPAERSAQARKAANARWKRERGYAAALARHKAYCKKVAP